MVTLKRVVVNSLMSKCRPVRSGVPHRPVLGLALFNKDRTWTCSSRAKGGHKNDQRNGTPLL